MRFNSAGLRTQWSKDSSCQKGLPVRPRMRLASLAVTPFSPFVMRRMGIRGAINRSTWLGMTTHDHEGLQSVMPQDTFASIYSVNHAAGDAGIFEPEWAFRGLVQDRVQNFEPSSA